MRAPSLVRGWAMFLALSIGGFSCAAHAAHGMALWGSLKYPAGFTHFDYVNPTAPKGGTLKLSTSATFDSVNPFILRGLAAPGLTNFLYQSLMTPSYDEPQSYYALVADSVTLAPDRSHAIFHLNPHARWHDGTPITATDVVFSLKMLQEKGHPFYRVQLKPITVEALDAGRVRFHFADKNQRELPHIAASMPILPAHYFCAITETAPTAACVPFDKTTLTPPLGSGPYRVASIDPGRAITYARVENYWGANLPSQKGLNNFDTIRYDVYRDDVVAIEGIKSHQFDFYEEFIARNWATSYDIPAVKSGALIKTLVPHQLPRGMQGFIFNTRSAKFADRRVREAIGLAMDFEWMNKTLFYGAYSRNASYFNHTEFEAKEVPEGDELDLLKEIASRDAQNVRKEDTKSATRTVTPPPVGGRLGGGRSDTPRMPNMAPPQPSPYGGGSRSEHADAAILGVAYVPPVTDGSGQMRDLLIRAQSLLNEAGWVMRDGVRVNAQTGEALTLEFLMTQRTFERVISVMRHNLKRLGIEASFRYVDPSQYQKRVDDRQFDVISIWWNQGKFYPSSEQYLYWHSSQAEIPGSQNLGGVNNPLVDTLVEKIQSATSLDTLRPAARGLDRVLRNEHYVIPHWNINAWRVVYWDQFGRPTVTPAYNLAIDSWWQAAPDANSQESSQAKSLSKPRIASHGEPRAAGVSEAKGTRSPSGEKTP